MKPRLAFLLAVLLKNTKLVQIKSNETNRITILVLQNLKLMKKEDEQNHTQIWNAQKFESSITPEIE